MLYILSAPAVPIPEGESALIRISPVTVEEARRLAGEGFVSAVGHEATAEVISHFLGLEVSVNRKNIYLQPGDKALQFVLKQRLEEGLVIGHVADIDRIGWYLMVATRME